MIRFADFLKITTTSVALIGGTALAVAVIAPDVAYAGKGNGNVGGNSDKASGNSSNGKAVGKTVGNSRAKGGGSSRAKTASRDPIKSLSDLIRGKSGDRKVQRNTKRKSKAATSRAPKVAAAPAPKPRGNPLSRELGVHPSELGALNAAHASSTALANASPNSRVGKLVLYMNEVEMSREIAADLEAAREELSLLDEPTRSQEEIDAAIDVANGERADLEDQLADLNQQLDDAGGSDADIETQIDDVTMALDDKNSEITDLEQERADGEAYAAAQDEVDRLEGELESQEADQRAALEDAANKPVTDEVEGAVQKLLGIYEEPVEPDTEEEDVTVVIEDEVVVVE